MLLLAGFGCAGKQPALRAGYPSPYKVFGKWYQPIPSADGFEQEGIASWYGDKFHGKKTANGETYNMHAMTAAHKTLPLGTWVEVKNLKNRRTVIVRVNDRGPFVSGRIIDLSNKAARKIDMVGAGTAPVKIRAIKNRKKTVREAAYTGGYSVQAGSFAGRENAEAFRDKLAGTFENVHVVNEEGLWKVRVGNCATLEKAAEVKITLADHGYVSAFTVREQGDGLHE